MVTPVQSLRDMGQSVWYDDISRAMIESGGLRALIENGVTGLTSNPTIFHKAITESSDYDDELMSLAEAGKSTREIFETMAIADIRDAAGPPAPRVRRDRRSGRVRVVRGQPAVGARHREHDPRGATALLRHRPSQHHDQGARDAGGHTGHRDADRRGHQRQRHADILPRIAQEGCQCLYLRVGAPGGAGRRPVEGVVGRVVLREPRRYRRRQPP